MVGPPLKRPSDAPFRGCQHYSQDCGNKNEPKFLRCSQLAARFGETALRVETVGQSNVDPDEHHRGPADKAMVTFKQTGV